MYRRGPDPAATQRALARLDAMTPAEVRQTFVDAGIIHPDGTLAPPYNGELGPLDFTQLDGLRDDDG